MRGLLIVIAACGGSTSSTKAPPPAQPPANTRTVEQDVCVAALDKLGPMLERRFQTKITPAEREKAIAECRNGGKDAREVFDCVVKAADDDAIVACMDPRANPKRQKEPHPDLDLIVENLRIYHISHEVLMEGKVALTPDKPCCSFPDAKCPAGSWSAETWNTLGLDNAKPRRFQYRFEGTRQKVVVEAVGDLDCDGRTVTYRRELEMRSDGNMHITVLDPKDDED